MRGKTVVKAETSVIFRESRSRRCVRLKSQQITGLVLLIPAMTGCGHGIMQDNGTVVLVPEHHE